MFESYHSVSPAAEQVTKRLAKRRRTEFPAPILQETIARVSNLSCQWSCPESQSLISPSIERVAKFRLTANLGVRGVAILEGVKGLLVLLVGFGLTSLVHHDVERFVVGLVRHIHLTPASHYPRIFVEAAASATDARLWFLSLAALLYAAVRFIEAYGLWYQRHWAEVFAVVTGAIYLPSRFTRWLSVSAQYES